MSSGYSANFPILAGPSPMSGWEINSTCGAFWSGKQNNEVSTLKSTTFPLCSRERVGVLGELSETSPRPWARKGALRLSWEPLLDSQGLRGAQLCRQLLAEALDPGACVCVSEVGEQGRDPGRVFPARCQAGRKDITLAKLIALSGIEVISMNPKSHSTVSAG